MYLDVFWRLNTYGWISVSVNWTEWSDWTEVEDMPKKIRSRDCSNSAPSLGGEICTRVDGLPGTRDQDAQFCCHHDLTRSKSLQHGSKIPQRVS